MSLTIVRWDAPLRCAPHILALGLRKGENVSQTQFAFLKKENVPSRDQLQSSIDALGFDLKLDPKFTPFKDEGFSPCILRGEDNVGFEIFYERTSDLIEEDEDDGEFKELIGNNDYSISLCWGGSFKDCTCVLMVSIALAKDFGATISYEGDGKETIEGMQGGIQECLEEINKGES